MALLKIARMGNPILARVADPVADPTAPDIRRLAADMIETMHDAPGIGLAAPQVHVPLRVVVFYLPPHRCAPGEQPVKETAMINPVIEPLGDDRGYDWEGCLSVPEWRGRVPRFTRIRYSYHTLDGEVVTREVGGFHARVVQHECDHLDGVLYPRRMTDLGDLVHMSEMRHRMAAG
ncbi:MAG: peptide deformylase [Alphaproteobacteria bacterium]|jgi:peptide deformylase|nr:peptide deformylase [Alphaproteobacteria bacterium]